MQLYIIGTGTSFERRIATLRANLLTWLNTKRFFVFKHNTLPSFT